MNSLRKKNSSRRKKVVFWTVISLLLLGVLGLTHDIIITNILAYRICKSDPKFKTFIKSTIEYPESIYWEDNVYPGFDEKDRLLMIRNYLDGVHLTTMALNGSDGTIYLFKATAEDWNTSREIKAGQRQGNYYETIKEEAQTIAARGKTMVKEVLPIFKYSAVFNPVELTKLERKYLYSDEVSIVHNETGEVVAYNQRLMRRWYLLMPDVAMGNRYFYPESVCGQSGYFLSGSVFKYSKEFHNQIQTHVVSLNSLLYMKELTSREGRNER